ncbi:DUF5132 domain-containing protein [Spirulina sp. CCNP1310]|uniref:DUF5132 domain-containing protein n=1 Tax=Spirulina sp. CCNP1310 TaxID=3110249 RepID=UPI002B21E10B|nr:DUF5132 domain-containing protein [Spirulina sp. CCNP1310]MEA5420950.1 DUF5132 domain-containing protein [Spirulina sp. CCNP1310]
MNQGQIGLRARVEQLASNPGHQVVTRALVVGVAAAVVVPVVLPLAKPFAKATIKAGVTLIEKTKMAVAETMEMVADIAAEARAEVQTAQAQAAPVGESAPSGDANQN